MQQALTAKDFTTEQTVRWCPGCGDYAILKQVRTALAFIGTPKENVVFVSGIGCSSRFPYYVDTYGLHSIHGRATSIATGLKATRPDLSIWVITGDGDCLSIGGNHFIHTLRRNPNLNILLFNNQIYGLTKGQYSPTSETKKISPSSPQGSIEQPLNTALLAMGAQASFIARSVDTEGKHLQDMLLRSEAHRGTSLLEIYQNCNIFNDGAFEQHKDKKIKHEHSLFVEKDKPLVFGKNQQFGIRLDGTNPQVVETASYSLSDLWIHDESNKEKAVLLARFPHLHTTAGHFFPTPMGVLLSEQRPVFEEEIRRQKKEQFSNLGKGSLQELMTGGQAWQVY